MAYDIVLFDVDGTLCDPGNSITESARYALAELGVSENDETALRRFVGPPLEHSFRDYYGFDEVTIRQAVVLFRDKLQKDGIRQYVAYPGVAELLQSLQAADKTLGIVTSKIEHIAEDALKQTGIRQYFDVIGAQQSRETVDKKVILGRAIGRLQVADTARVVMVGDRKHDIEAAKAHGVDSVGVLWGYGSRTELQHERATYIAQSAQELFDIVIGPKA